MEKKIIKVDNKVIVLFEDGTYLENDGLAEEDFIKLLSSEDPDEIALIMDPSFSKIKEEYQGVKELLNSVGNSKILTLKGDSVYWEEVSELSMPPEFVKAVLDAEENNDEIRIDTYKNFWTLMCLNPDERCRQNLFWFLNKNGLTISRCGFFVAYRNADYKCKDSDDTEVYTDCHSHTFNIRIGQVVTMPREKCDTVQEHTCSHGLICSPVY